ncbi:MAG: MBL fold metallo-hydrolase [Elusimicrobia bacterium]|nr:MBL fold metallo-hydrolase [Elusimicrobiota bacterium]
MTKLRRPVYAAAASACLIVTLLGRVPLFAGGSKEGAAPLVARRAIPVNYKRSANDMIVTFIDVGQGNSVLVESPTGATILFDAGGNPEWMKSSWDPGMQIVLPYIEANGISKIDYAVMSHAHGDHIGGYRAIILNMKIGEFIDPGYAYTSSVYKELLETIKEKDLKYRIARSGEGEDIVMGPDISCKIFNPPTKFYFQGTNSDCNNSSVLLKVTYRNVSFLLTGDIEDRVELYCTKKFGGELAANILQVPHHGSYTSSTKPFLNTVMPEVAIIPVGANNTFGHPRPEALHNLESVGAEIFRTDYDGNVTVYTDGKTFVVETGK